MEFKQLDYNFFQNMLRRYLKNEKADLRQVEKILASDKGDNFFSEIYRIYLIYTPTKKIDPKEMEDRVCCIVKVEKSSLKSETMHKIFNTELKVLEQVLPRVEKFVQCTLGPKLIYGDKNANFIVMEDLFLKDYTMQNRQKGLSLQHCLIAIETLAKFHAGSVALTEKEPHLTRSFDNGMISGKYPENYFRFLEVSLSNLIEGVASWNDNECNQAISKLKNIIKTMKSRLLSMYENEISEFCVLNHGDYWTNNIMFKHNGEGEPYDALMIDYQCPIYTSPAIDLQYFLCTCPELEIKCEKDDYFLEKYLNILGRELEKTGCKKRPPQMDQLKKSIYKRRIFSIFSGLIYFPRMMCDKSDVEEFDKVLVNGETKLDIFKNPDTGLAVRKLLKAMNERGYLD